MGKKKRYTADEMAQMEKQKNRKQFNAKLDDLGLQYEEVDIPPDEVDRDEVAKTLMHTLRSMIPYTKEYYEGMAAEMEMDDLHKIRVEQAKAKELLSKTRTGQHVEALEEMMDDTNRDFHFFNKLKHQQTVDGKYKYQPLNVDPFKYIGRGQNRVRKAVVGQFSMLDNTLLAKLSAHGRQISGATKLQEDRDKSCTWKGKGPNGQPMKCFNARAFFKFRFKKDRRGNDEPEYTAHCEFHAPSCLGEHNPMAIPKVITPNSEGLCNECFLHKHKSLPPKDEANLVPGLRTVEEETGSEHGSDDGSSVNALSVVRKNTVKEEVIENELTEDSCCNWRPDEQESLTQMKGFICKNKVYRNPETRILYPTCSMHIKYCIKKHAPGTSSFIDVPNVYGYCNTHHMAEFACTPIPIPFPFPGMTYRLVPKGWMVKPAHWAAPTWRPLKDFKPKKRYREPDKPIGYLNKLREAANVLRYRRRKKQFGKLAATVIQCVYRGYRVRGSHKPALYQRQKLVRSAKIIIIQCQFRRFLHNRVAKRKREAYTIAAIQIQKCIRGFFGRKFVRRHKAAIVLQNSSKTFKDRRFFNMVMMVVQLRGVLKRREDACIYIQKVARGYMVRARIYYERLKSLDRYHKAAVFITKLYGAYKAKQARKQQQLRLLQRNKLLRRLAQMIEDLYFQRKDYRELVVVMKRSAPIMQAVVRGYIALKGATRMKFLRQAMVSWCDPHHAKQFLNDYLSRLIPPDLSTKNSVASSITEVNSLNTNSSGKGDGFLCNHIPLRRGHVQEYVDYPTLVAALQSWYKSCEKPLLLTEISSIYGRFRNPNNSRVRIPDIDEYIKHHVEPCRKHARTICGDCVYFRECHFGICACTEFKKDKRTGLVCLHCSHPMSHHKLLPMALNPAKKKENTSLLTTLNTVLKPDLSLPSTIKGVEMDKIADQITKHHKRIAQRSASCETFANQSVPIVSCENTANSFNALQSTSKMSYRASTSINPSLSAAISALEVVDVTNNKQYWEQNDPALKLNITTLETPPTHVKASHVSPLVNINQNEFWSAAAKNPNKTLRDYNEKFEHNMPLPIVQNGQMFYTLEGPLLYVQILEKIVWLEESGETPNGIHSDEGSFLRLVVDHIQMFERHWRKMVADIRMGTLNRQVQCSEETRIAYTASAMPRPLLGVKLDKAFRNLGFHMKVIGKDIPMKSFADRKIPKVIERRRPSFPDNSMGSTGFSESNILLGLSGDITKNDSTSPPSSPLKLSVVPSHASLSPIRHGRSSSHRKRSNRVESLLMATSVGTASLKELDRRAEEKKTRGATASRKVKVRRGSDTDICRPATTEEVHKLRHDVLTEPRTDYHHLVHIDGRFICPFPACGKSYTSRSTAFEHLKSHEQRKRLYAPSPLADSHMNAYWPDGNTWRDTTEFKKRSIPPGAVVCTQPNCKEIFSNKNRLEYHMRWVHNMGIVVDTSLQSFYTFIGQHTPTPPNPPPKYAPLVYCSMHLTLDNKCPKCITITNSDEPKQPLFFYETLSINFTERFGSGGSVVIGRDEQKGVHFTDRNSVSDAIRWGRVAAVLRDGKGDAWVAVQLLINMDEAKKAKRSLARDVDMHHELMLAIVNAPPTWILLTQVKSTFYLLEVNRDEFNYRQRNDEVPKQSYFIRPKRVRKEKST